MEQPIHILLVSDRLELLEPIRSVVAETGCEVVSASDEASLADALKTHGPVAAVFGASKAALEMAKYTEGLTDGGIPKLVAIEDDAGDQVMTHILAMKDCDWVTLSSKPDILRHKTHALVQLGRRLHFLTSKVTLLKSRREELTQSVEQMRGFVGIVAHDLRAPLGKMINISEVLISGVDAEELLTFYRLMHKTSKRAFGLVNDILDLTAVESGQVQLDFQKCDIWPLAIQIVSELGYLAGEKTIKLVNNIKDPLEVRADGRRVFQVLVNLITNAVKFTPRRGSVTLAAEPIREGVKVSVTDTGVGIPPERIETLFQKHKKFSTQGTDGERGTGIGLPLSQELIRAHGSKILVESEEGRGSCFSFVLPWWQEE